jgi:hypothetical protein
LKNKRKSKNIRVLLSVGKISVLCSIQVLTVLAFSSF